MNEHHLPRIGVRIAVSFLFVLAFGALYWYFVTTEAGQRADAATLGATEWYRVKLGGLEYHLRRLAPLVAVAAAGAALVYAGIRRRWHDLLWAAALPVVGYGLAGVLRNYVLARPELGDFAYPVNTLPTGRVVATVACLVVAVWLAPPSWWRSPLIVGSALLAAVVGTAQVATFAHRYADVIASALLVGVLAPLWPIARRPVSLVAIIAWVVAGSAATGVGTWFVIRWDAEGYPPATQVAACLGIAMAMAGSAALALIASTVVPKRS